MCYLPTVPAEPAPRLEVLYDAAAVAAGVRRVADAIGRDLAGRTVLAVPVMNGALFFAADLLRALPSSVACAGFCSAAVSSYGAGTSPSGRPAVHAFPSAEQLAGRVALVIDTVLDTGATVEAVRAEALARGAAAVRVACLLDKSARRTHPVRADWAAFSAPDRFLVGYGLDAGGRWRTLPYVAALETVDVPG